MKRGFTIVELAVVVTVIGILVGLSVFAYNQLQERSADAQTKSMVAVLTSALNSYYAKNNEYPTAAQLFGGTPNGGYPASYSTAASLLNLNTSAFTSKHAKFMPCAGSGGMSSACSYENLGWVGGIENVKYITKNAGETSLEKQYFVASPNGPGTALAYCELVMRPTIEPTSVYVITYWSREETKVKFVKSEMGEVRHYSPEAGQCVFTTP